MLILFVCTGNTCRSPMAAFLLRDKVRQEGLDWQVDSAGIFAAPGMPMSGAAESALLSMGIGQGEHQSKGITPDLLQRADYVFTMTDAHRLEVLSRFPQFSDKVFQLGRFAANGFATDDGNGRERNYGEYDIVDPFGGSTGEYLGCAIQLNEMMDELISKLTRAEDGSD